MAISVAVVIGDIADTLVTRVADKTRKLKIGNGATPGMDGVRFYTRRKAITQRWPEGDIAAEYVIPTLK